MDYYFSCISSCFLMCVCFNFIMLFNVRVFLLAPINNDHKKYLVVFIFKLVVKKCAWKADT